MKGPYIDSCIRTEIQRARKAGYYPNRTYLMRETGLKPDQLELRISRITRQMKRESGGE